MKIKSICNQLRVALKHSALALAVGTAVMFGAGPSAHASTITYDFASPSTPNMEGWTSVYGEIWANNSDWGWIADNGHLGIINDWLDSAELAHSQPFKLDGSGDLTGRMIGHASTNPDPPVHSADIGPLSIIGGLGDGGFIGVALRDVLTDTYVLWKAHPGSNFDGPDAPLYTDLVFTTAELLPYANDGRTYTLDFIENDRGAPDASPQGSTGKWGILGSATIPGVVWNDDFANAINLPGASGIQTGTNNNGATVETGEPSANGETNTVWFKWTCASDGDLTFKTDGSTNTGAGEWDSVIGIYTGATVDALTPLGTTPKDTVLEESMTVPVTSGTTYYIQLAGYGHEEAANIKLTWNFVGPQADILAFGPGATVGTVVDNAAPITWNLITGTDKATLHPTFTLSPGATCKVLGVTVHSGDLVDLTAPVEFRVTSGDASTINTYTATVNLVTLTGIINVSYEAGSIPDPSTLTGPAGGSGQTWNQPTTFTGSGLIDAVGNATSIGWSNTGMEGIDNWGNPVLKVLTSGMRNFSKGAPQQFVINGLTVGAYYNVWIASQQPNSEKAKGDWSTTNTTSTVGDQPIDATGIQNTSTWQAGNNFVYFDHVLVNGSGQIVLNGLSATGYRLPVNGFQLVPTTAPVTDYGTWAATYLPTDVSNPAADSDGDGMTNQQEYAFGLNPTSGSSVSPITVQLDKAAGTFSYTRRATPATTGLTYTVLYSTDLATWTVDGDAISTPDAATPVQTVAVALSVPTSTYPKLFVRVMAD